MKLTRIPLPLLVLLILIVGSTLSLSVGAQNLPVPDTYVATGVIANTASPYQPAPFGAYGTLLNSPTSGLPTYVGFRYELYRDALGHPAYSGMATAKIVFLRKSRYFCFADPAIGGAGSFSTISTDIQLGTGCGFILSKSATPHWEIEVEPRAQRVPALQSGVSGAVLVGVSYTFNRPK